jgi:hypothetical protein
MELKCIGGAKPVQRRKSLREFTHSLHGRDFTPPVTGHVKSASSSLVLLGISLFFAQQTGESRLDFDRRSPPDNHSGVQINEPTGFC